MGGEHSLAPSGQVRVTGSPPHGRGTPGRSCWTTPPERAHPRMGGEHCAGQAVGDYAPGSPPHGRGTHGPRGGHPGRDRLTPAWAGNTRGRSGGCGTRGAHPRMGGEHSRAATDIMASQGSPPHGRGTPAGSGRRRQDRGLTPAWAGNTVFEAVSRNDMTGSPPHGRGTLDQPGRRPRVRGLTPAWAGNTPSPGRLCPPRRAHPRMGGEHRLGQHCQPPVEGSPPHGRGTPPPREVVDPRPGLTPAWAGNTSAPSERPPSPEAHPRMGGEHSALAAVGEFAAGSPPHGRGTPRCWRPVVDAGGLTPAWAGNTGR